MTKEGLSITEKLILAAYGLEEAGKRPFSAEDLVVAAWQKFPDAFGLAGYRDDRGRLSYPNSNRVFAEIMGAKPIRTRGLLAKVGNKKYQLTEAGRELARTLPSRGGIQPPGKAALGVKTEEELKRLLGTKALQKFRNRRIDDLNFYDACAFWAISPMSSAIELQGRVANFEDIVGTARQVVREGSAAFKHGGYTFGGRDLDDLLETHRVLLYKFKDEINVINKRGDERKV